MGYSEKPAELFEKSRYTVNGSKDAHDDQGQKILSSCRESGFKLRMTILLYRNDASTNSEILRIKAQSAIGPPYYVYDSATEELVGVFNRPRSIRSFARSQYEILDSSHRQVATVKEGSLIQAYRWRRSTELLPVIGLLRCLYQGVTWQVQVGNHTVATYVGRRGDWNIEIHFTFNQQESLDRRLVVALALLVAHGGSTDWPGCCRIE